MSIFENGSGLPLEGVRIVDLTVAWSGPGVTSILADLGAEVVRIEANNRPSRQAPSRVTTPVTGYAADLYVGRDPGSRPYDRTAMFNWHARNKLSACVNLDTAEGREAALRLLDVSDVFVENNAAGVLEKLGLSPALLHERNPRLIILRMPPLGLSGPMSHYIGFGPNFNALVGLASFDGYEGEEADSAGDNFEMDEATPAAGALAVMMGLWDRETTGRGEMIELAQAENLLSEIGEYFLDYQMNGRLPIAAGNMDNVNFQGVFPTKGDDAWVAISIRNDSEWQNLVNLSGGGQWASLGNTSIERLENANAIVAGISEWTAIRDGRDVVSALQALRIPAGEVFSETDLLENAHLAARAWFKTRSHPSTGTHAYPGHPWIVDGFELAFGRPLPGFGEDNHYVYKDLLKYSDEEYQRLTERELVTDYQV